MFLLVERRHGRVAFCHAEYNGQLYSGLCSIPSRRNVNEVNISSGMITYPLCYGSKSVLQCSRSISFETLRFFSSNCVNSEFASQESGIQVYKSNLVSMISCVLEIFQFRVVFGFSASEG